MLEWLSHLLVLLRELKRRKVVKVAILYAVGWAAGLQIVDAAVSAYELPAVITTIAGKLLLFGFFAAVILSWLFDWTEAGIIRAQPWPALTDSQRIVLYRGVIAMLAVLIILFMAFLIWQARTGTPPPQADGAADSPVLALFPFRSASEEADGTANALEALMHHALTVAGGHVLRVRDAMTDAPSAGVTPEGEGAGFDAEYHVAGDVTLAGESGLLILQITGPSGMTLRTWQFVIEAEPTIEALRRVAGQACDSILAFVVQGSGRDRMRNGPGHTST